MIGVLLASMFHFWTEPVPPPYITCTMQRVCKWYDGTPVSYRTVIRVARWNRLHRPKLG